MYIDYVSLSVDFDLNLKGYEIDGVKKFNSGLFRKGRNRLGVDKLGVKGTY